MNPVRPIWFYAYVSKSKSKGNSYTLEIGFQGGLTG